MDEYLVDVPVRINIWIRKKCQRRQFDIIKTAKPSTLFLISDGGRNTAEMEVIQDNRKYILDNIDWNCTVYKIFEEKNNGLYTMSQKGLDLIWSKVDRCIFLEDDDLPSVSFFRYCAELLEKYKDDQRIECICGHNILGVSPEVTTDYFFARQGSIWGTATWKRVDDERGHFEYIDDPYIMKLLKQRTRHNKTAWKKLKAYGKHSTYEGHVPAREFYNEFHMYSQNRLQIVPKYNLICNIGYGEDAEHMDILEEMPKASRRMFNMHTYELSFPMRCAEYVIPDIDFEKNRNRVLAYNAPILHTFRLLERAFLKIKAGKIKELVTIVKKKFKSEK